MTSEIVDALAGVLHSQWRKARQDEGFHAPERCPNYESAVDEDGDGDPHAGLIHCNHCDTNLQPYETLESYLKAGWRQKAESLHQALQVAGLTLTRHP